MGRRGSKLSEHPENLLDMIPHTEIWLAWRFRISFPCFDPKKTIEHWRQLREDIAEFGPDICEFCPDGPTVDLIRNRAAPSATGCVAHASRRWKTRLLKSRARLCYLLRQHTSAALHRACWWHCGGPTGKGDPHLDAIHGCSQTVAGARQMGANGTDRGAHRLCRLRVGFPFDADQKDGRPLIVWQATQCRAEVAQD
jgi:hypothetical protein